MPARTGKLEGHFFLLMPELRRRHASKHREANRAAIDSRVVILISRVVILSIDETWRNESRCPTSTDAIVRLTARSQAHIDPLLWWMIYTLRVYCNYTRVYTMRGTAHTVAEKQKLLNCVRRLRGQVDAIERAPIAD